MFYIRSCLSRSNKFWGFIYDPVGLVGLMVIDFYIHLGLMTIVAYVVCRPLYIKFSAVIKCYASENTKGGVGQYVVAGAAKATQVIRAEAIWAHFIAEKNLPFAICDVFTRMAGHMFPDSEIAKGVLGRSNEGDAYLEGRPCSTSG